MTAQQFIRCKQCRTHYVCGPGDRCVYCVQAKARANRAQAKNRAQWKKAQYQAEKSRRAARQAWCPDPATCHAHGRCATVGTHASIAAAQAALNPNKLTAIGE